ncbi:DNA gyrase/topoisomerase IV subunit A [Vicingus serpentipes]|uniref:DNA gyrase/topoisomerase IV subunit A n=1 Tax=Vicingus serpentipes TaxID=1926625 RepID=A0A5C6RV12_9FLAO|nr:DNA gyrase/topoisomerase IV subunit A [Vicingus serpentipes]TXB65894.1 DNA gyrase/topoisomerase IV subunit A [Vicingus serpentipes]
MAENEEDNIERDEEFEQPIEGEQLENVIQVSGMYQEWFLDYASYVILERAVPHLHDGLKPVQRRILHSMKEMDDGRYNKVANIIGNTMKYHPHGDASIGDALVQLGQKDLLIDCQGNWGNIFTGDRAAAPRYIEARLTKFGLEVVFNPKTTTWLSSYDGRNKEPETLPVKFPLLLAQGVEGIAVGLACKILPHNFNELIDGSIAILKGKKVNIYPDFITGGMADFSAYNDGLRGGRVKVRARIVQEDKKTLKVTELPFGSTTDKLIDSILKANSKGKIKLKKVEDNTSDEVEILIHLQPGESPDKMIDALYAFTDCEVSISPNSGVIEDDKPKFIGVNEMLRLSTHQTVDLLKLELEIKLAELHEQWHFSSLEKIFIENKIYVKLHGLGYEEAIELTHELLKPYIKHLLKEVSDDDVKRLLEIKMRRITKHDSDKAEDKLLSLEDEIKQVKYDLEHLVDFAINYFKEIKRKYGEGRERKTEIRSFENIDAAKVAVSNVKLYVNKEEGFAGFNLKRGEGDLVCDCSDIDDIIVIREDGNMIVSRISQKAFFGKGIIHIGVWKKGDKRTIYNLIYQDGKAGDSMMKRFAVTSITRDKEYPLTKGTPNSKVLWFSANPNGEAETVLVKLKPKANVRKLKFEIDFSELAIKGRAAGGNRVTKYGIAKIELKEKGVSTLSARKIWFDDTVQRLNSDGRGEFLGDFKAEDKILTIMQSGDYQLTGFDLFTKFEEDMIVLEKWNPEKPVSAIYFDGEKQQYNVKRFLIEPTDKKTSFISEHEDSYLEVVSTDWLPQIQINYSKVKGVEKDPDTINLEEFIAIKGLKAIGNRLTTNKVKNIDLLEPLPYEEPLKNEEVEEDESEIEEATAESIEEVEEIVQNEDEETEEDEEVIEIKEISPKEDDKKIDLSPKQKTKSKPIKDVDDDDVQMKLF